MFARLIFAVVVVIAFVRGAAGAEQPKPAELAAKLVKTVALSLSSPKLKVLAARAEGSTIVLETRADDWPEFLNGAKQRGGFAKTAQIWFCSPNFRNQITLGVSLSLSVRSSDSLQEASAQIDERSCRALSAVIRADAAALKALALEAARMADKSQLTLPPGIAFEKTVAKNDVVEYTVVIQNSELIDKFRGRHDTLKLAIGANLCPRAFKGIMKGLRHHVIFQDALRAHLFDIMFDAASCYPA